MEVINTINDYLWTYVMVGLLLGGALFFTVYTRGVQFKMIPQMFKLLFESSKNYENPDDPINKKKTISSFQAFAVSLASRVGTGNIAGVAIAIALGGPGSVFWMWIVALIGSANAFIESTLAQLFKVRDKDAFRGGPAYYIMKGMHKRWWAITFSVLITLTFGLAFNTVQANTIVTAFQGTFGLPPLWVGIVTTVISLLVICGGIQRISKVSEIVVPIMAGCYILMAIYIICAHITDFPAVISLIVRNAFGIEQIMGGGVGMAIILGVKRGLFSNEAGEGSTPNAAATADVSHPVKQGLIQTLGVFTDTMLVCTSTAFIILCSGVFDSGLNGIELTEAALKSETGEFATWFLAVAIYLFAFTSVIANYYYGETNLNFIYKNKWIIYAFRLCVGGTLMIGALSSLEFVWAISDITMGLMTLCNMTAILFLGKYAVKCLRDYLKQLKEGKDPQFTYKVIPEIEDEIKEAWPD
ncbi:MAG: alanine:cation symporter family protein [Muribaculaceae bacterium]|nr:alanine:cation symporter family protein [Muribaculaceae bacterium]